MSQSAPPTPKKKFPTCGLLVVVLAVLAVIGIASGGSKSSGSASTPSPSSTPAPTLTQFTSAFQDTVTVDAPPLQQALTSMSKDCTGDTVTAACKTDIGAANDAAKTFHDDLNSSIPNDSQKTGAKALETAIANMQLALTLAQDAANTNNVDEMLLAAQQMATATSQVNAATTELEHP